jgi:O-antigen/teichoic acid export membrane protein
MFEIGSRLTALIVLSRLLSPADFGLYGIGISIALILATLAQLGVPTNLIYLSHVDRKSFAAGSMLCLTSAAVISIACACFVTRYGPFEQDTTRNVLLAFLAYVTIQVFINMLEALARRIYAFRSIAFCDLGSTMVGSLFVPVVLALGGWGVWSLVVGQFVGASIRLFGLLNICRAFVGFRTTVAEVRRVASASFAVTVAELANIATVHAQRPLIGLELGTVAAGLWTRFYQVILLQLTLIIQPVDRFILPKLARSRERPEHVEQMTLLLIEVVTLVTIPLSVITALVAPVAIPLAFGPEWISLVVPMQIGAITFFFRGIDRILLTTARAIGQIRSRAVAQVLQLAIVIGAIYAAAPYGLETVAAAYVAAQAVSLAIMVGVMCVTTGVSVSRVVLRMIPGVATGAALLADGLLMAAIEYDSIFSLQTVARCLISVAICILMVIALRCLSFSTSLNRLLDQGVFRLIRPSVPREG